MARTVDPCEHSEWTEPSPLDESTVEQLSPEAVSRLFKEHNRALVGYLTARLRSEQEAREIAQESYVRLLQLHKSGTLSLFRAYLFKTATNLAIDRLRRRTVRDRVESVDLFEELNEPGVEAANPESVAIAEEQTLQLMQFLQELPQKCQEVFRLHRLEELGQHEVALKLRLSERMVRRYITYAMVYCRLRLIGLPLEQVRKEVIL